jgi:hypothetical protein
LSKQKGNVWKVSGQVFSQLIALRNVIAHHCDVPTLRAQRDGTILSLNANRIDVSRHHTRHPSVVPENQFYNSIWMQTNGS